MSLGLFQKLKSQRMNDFQQCGVEDGLKPVLVGQFEFVEWTPDNHLRHSRFVGLREGIKAVDIGRET